MFIYFTDFITIKSISQKDLNTYEENIEIHQKHQASCPPAVYNMKPMQIPSTIPIKAITKPVNIPQISRVTPKRPALQEKVFYSLRSVF